MLRTGVRHPDAAEAAAGCSAMERAQPEPEPGGDENVAQLYATLNEYLRLEHKYQPRLCLPADTEHAEVSSGARDGAAHVLRCLKVWYDLPPDVLLHAINLFDRFLTKMKVRPCHVPCITISCMNIAIEANAAACEGVRTVSIEELVSISQSACTARDVARMSNVVRDKLSLAPGAPTVTSLHWLRLFQALLTAAARSLGLHHQVYQCSEIELVNFLEIVACDASCANARTSELALVLLYHKLECQLMEWSRHAELEGGPPVPEDAYCLFDFAVDLQKVCQMSDTSLVETQILARSVLARYEARGKSTHRQRLVWKLSERTLKVLRPTDRLTSLLPTIEEQHFAAEGVPQRSRSGSESSDSSEDTADWPRSPVLPVYCDN